jgi:hypothetical protein
MENMDLKNFNGSILKNSTSKKTISNHELQKIDLVSNLRIFKKSILPYFLILKTEEFDLCIQNFNHKRVD